MNINQQMSQKLKGREDLMKKIIPTNFGVGCRRPTPGNGFLEALTLPHVRTFTQEMRRVTPKGFVDHEGVEHEVDVIICATGFDTSWRPRFPVVANGTNIQDLYAKEPLSYLSIGVPEIPHYLTVTGPYGPVGHGSFLPIIELLQKHFISYISKFQRENIQSLAPKLSTALAFKEHADLFLRRTAWTSGCSSWFKQGKIDGPLAMWPGSRIVYFELLKNPRWEDYEIKYGGKGGNEFGFLGNGFAMREYDGGDLSWYLGDDEHLGGMIPERKNAADKVKGNGVGNRNGYANGGGVVGT